MMSNNRKDRVHCDPRAGQCLLLLILAFFCLHCSSASSDVIISPVHNVRYVDSAGTNFLFRGERPLTGDGIHSAAFNLDGLRNAIAEQAALAGVVLPPSYTLVVISLLWMDDIDEPEQAAMERGLLLAEFSFFQSYPQLGQVYSWTSKAPA